MPIKMVANPNQDFHVGGEKEVYITSCARCGVECARAFTIGARDQSRLRHIKLPQCVRNYKKEAAA
jgi:hypothetical protein